MSEKANSGLKRPRQATMGRPKYKVGIRASSKPPVQAQSAGDQNTAALERSARLAAMPAARGWVVAGQGWAGSGVTAPGPKPNQFWLHTKPVRLPIMAWWGINAPLGAPVVPLV